MASRWRARRNSQPSTMPTADRPAAVASAGPLTGQPPCRAAARASSSCWTMPAAASRSTRARQVRRADDEGGPPERPRGSRPMRDSADWLERRSSRKVKGRSREGGRQRPSRACDATGCPPSHPGEAADPRPRPRHRVPRRDGSMTAASSGACPAGASGAAGPRRWRCPRRRRRCGARRGRCPTARSRAPGGARGRATTSFMVRCGSLRCGRLQDIEADAIGSLGRSPRKSGQTLTVVAPTSASMARASETGRPAILASTASSSMTW